MRNMSDKSLREIQGFELLGFARSSQVLLNYARRDVDSRVRIFRSGISARAGRKGSTRYSSTDIFGTHMSYIYNVKCKKEFTDFLVNKFLEKNPDPDSGMRAAFTHILHVNRLHWKQCWCVDKDR